jgi:hypothetical protein
MVTDADGKVGDTSYLTNQASKGGAVLTFASG